MTHPGGLLPPSEVVRLNPAVVYPTDVPAWLPAQLEQGAEVRVPDSVP